MDHLAGRRPADELERLHGLTRHTRLHAATLLGAHPGLRLSSGYRSPQRNAAVGGVRNSWHIVGRGCDFTGPLQLLRDALLTATGQRVTRGCSGPEEAFIEDPGEPNQHLHVAW